jgi:hypothetical protein
MIVPHGLSTRGQGQPAGLQHEGQRHGRAARSQIAARRLQSVRAEQPDHCAPSAGVLGNGVTHIVADPRCQMLTLQAVVIAGGDDNQVVVEQLSC